MSQTEQEYPSIDTSRIKEVCQDRIMVAWEFNTKYMMNGKLLRPDTHKKMHYTGTVMKMGRIRD